jgi:hypothetical protein
LAEPDDIEHEIPYDKPKTAVETVPDFLRKSIMWEFFVIALYLFQM